MAEGGAFDDDDDLGAGLAELGEGPVGEVPVEPAPSPDEGLAIAGLLANVLGEAERVFKIWKRMQSNKIRPEVGNVSPQKKLELTIIKRELGGGGGRRCEVV